MNPKVIVLILSFNNKHLLDDSVSSYLANDYPNFDVVVIDNGSTDGTRQYVREKWPEAFVLRTEKNLGYSGGFNFGLDFAFNQHQADYVLITNNDVKADSKVISSFLKTASKNNSIGFVTGKVFYFEKPDTLQSVGYIENPRTGEVHHRGQNLKDCADFNMDVPLNSSDDIFMLVKKDVYDSVGGYNPDFLFQCEQWDWQERAKQENFLVFFCAKAVIWHKESMTIGKSSPFKLYYDVRNTMLVIYIHKTRKQFLLYFWKSFKQNFIKGTLKNLLKGNFRHSFASFKGFISGCFSVLLSCTRTGLSGRKQ